MRRRAHGALARRGAPRRRRRGARDRRGSPRRCPGARPRAGAGCSGCGAGGCRRLAGAGRARPAAQLCRDGDSRRSVRRDRCGIGGAVRDRPRLRGSARRRRGRHRVREVRAAGHLDPGTVRRPHDAGGELPARRLQGRYRVRFTRRDAARDGRHHRPGRHGGTARDREPPGRSALAGGGAGQGRGAGRAGSAGGRSTARDRGGRVRGAVGGASRAARGVHRCRGARSRSRHAPRARHSAARRGRARESARQLSAAHQPARDRPGRQSRRDRHR